MEINNPLTLSHLALAQQRRAPLALMLGAWVSLALSLALSAEKADAKPRKRSRKTKISAPAIPPEALSAVKGVYQDLQDNPDAAVRLAITKGRIELGGEDRAQAVKRGLEAGDLAVKLVALEQVLSERKAFKEHVKGAEVTLKDLLTSKELKEHEAGVSLLEANFKKRARKTWIKDLLKSGSKHGAQYARAQLIEAGGREAWRVVEAGLKAPAKSAEHKQAIEAIQKHRYKQAKRWALEHAGDKSKDGEVARAWVSERSPKLTKRMNLDLIKQYKKAEGDFPRRVRLAHMLAARGELAVVRDTLVVAVKNKKGRIKEELDSAELRVMGWEGLRGCRDHEILSAVKGMMVNLQNRVEAAPAVDWLAEWVRDTNDPTAKKTLEDIAQQTQYVSRLEALRAFGTLKLRSSLPILEKGLKEGNSELRLVSAQAIAMMSTKGDEGRLHKALLKERKSDLVREALLEGVGNIGTSDTLKTIKYWLINRNSRLRKAALLALNKVNVGRADLERMLNSKLRNDPDKEIRLKVWEMLFKAKSDALKRQYKSAHTWLEPEQFTALSESVSLPDELLLSVAVKGDASLGAVVLGILKERGAQACDTLEKLVREAFDAKLQAQAAELYVSLKQKEGEAFYEELLSHREPTLRAIGLRAVAQHGADRFRQLTRNMMDNEGKPLPRVEAARAFYTLSLRAPKTP